MERTTISGPSHARPEQFHDDDHVHTYIHTGLARLIWLKMIKV